MLLPKSVLRFGYGIFGLDYFKVVYQHITVALPATFLIIAALVAFTYEL